MDFYVTAGAGIYSQITEFRGFNDFGGGPFSGRGGDLLYSNTIFKPGVDGPPVSRLTLGTSLM